MLPISSHQQKHYSASYFFTSRKGNHVAKTHSYHFSSGHEHCREVATVALYLTTSLNVSKLLKTQILQIANFDNRTSEIYKYCRDVSGKHSYTIRLYRDGREHHAQ